MFHKMLHNNKKKSSIQNCILSPKTSLMCDKREKQFSFLDIGMLLHFIYLCSRKLNLLEHQAPLRAPYSG
jgi:hypothetical protein